MFKRNSSKVLLASLMLLLLPQMAMAASAGLTQMLGTSQFKTGLTFGFAIFAFFKWVHYFSDFSVDKALKDAIVPAVLTVLTFQWQQIASWVGLA
jgi:hypothetical protein